MIKKAKFVLNISIEDEIGPSKKYSISEVIDFSEKDNDKIVYKTNNIKALKRITRRLRALLTNIAKYGEDEEINNKI
jgi:hypothetical protein